MLKTLLKKQMLELNRGFFYNQKNGAARSKASCIVMIVLFALLMVGFTVLYMLRDTWVTFMRSVGALYGADVAAMWLGKVRTALSFPGAGWIYVYLCFHRLAPAAWESPWRLSCYAVEGGLILLTLWSLHTYTVAYLPYLRRALERK